jgi:hypothetical protein
MFVPPPVLAPCLDVTVHVMQSPAIGSTKPSFDRDAYASIPMLIVQGAADSNTSLPSGNAPSESYSTAQGYLVRELFGETPLERIENIKPIFERVNPRVMFRIYPDVGHQITPVS